MGEVHEIFGGKQLTPEEIKKLEIEKTSIKSVSPEEQKETWHEAGKIAEKIVEDLEVMNKQRMHDKNS